MKLVSARSTAMRLLSSLFALGLVAGPACSSDTPMSTGDESTGDDHRRRELLREFEACHG